MTPEEKLSAGLVEVARVATESERARIRKLCLDEASREMQAAKQAFKKGQATGAAIERAEAYRKVARLLAPKKPKTKKARKVTK